MSGSPWLELGIGLPEKKKKIQATQLDPEFQVTNE